MHTYKTVRSRHKHTNIHESNMPGMLLSLTLNMCHKLRSALGWPAPPPLNLLWLRQGSISRFKPKSVRCSKCLTAAKLAQSSGWAGKLLQHCTRPIERRHTSVHLSMTVASKLWSYVLHVYITVSANWQNLKQKKPLSRIIIIIIIRPIFNEILYSRYLQK